MTNNSKSVKLFNLEDRKNLSGSITEVDIFQWKNTLLDNLKKDPEFKDHSTESSKWDVEKVKNRGFVDAVEHDGSAQKKAEQVHSMLTKIASYAPKTIVREITRRTKCLADIWNIARDWAGIKSTGSKHLDYYKTKLSFQRIDKEETRQEFFYRLRDAMEDTLILQSENITDDGERVDADEDMTPTVKSLVVLDWLDAIGGPTLVEHVHRVYAKELESATLASLQTRIWKNMDALMREADGEEQGDTGKVFKANAEDVILRQVNSGMGNRFRGNGRQFRGQNNSRQFQTNTRPFQQRGRGRGNPVQKRGGFQGSASSKFCKLCKAHGSPNYQSHDISDCWLLDERDRSKITNNYAKAQALFTAEEEVVEDTYGDDDEYDDEEVDEELEENYE